MGAQRLSDKSARKIAVATGLPVIRAWAHGGSHVKDFVTQGHLHGWFNPRTGSTSIDLDPFHYTTCPRPEGYEPRPGDDPMFPDGVPPLTPAEARAMLDAKKEPA